MLELQQVQSALRRVEPYVHHTPLIGSTGISRLAGRKVYFKCENFQKTGSFKIRGAMNSILSLTKKEKERGIICYSSGNHAQAVSYAAAILGIEAWVFMPENAVPAKVAACKGYGGHIVLYGSTGAESRIKALEMAKKKNLVYIDPVENLNIMAGQGTVGLEILADLPQADVAYVPVGGGGLISGIATAIKGLSAGTKVIGVEPTVMNCVGLSVHNGRITTIPRKYSIADGLAGDAPGPLAFENASHYVDEWMTVSDRQISQAMELILQRCKFVIEPSAAVTLAALLSRKAKKGSREVCVLSGGNVNLQALSTILENKK